MKTWTVEMIGEARELYIVDAETEEEARDNWMHGNLVLSEASGMEAVKVWLEDEW